MKLTILKVCSSSTKPNTSSGTMIILANLMNFESLWYNMENVKFFCQSFVKGLSWFSFQKIALALCNMIILKKKCLQIKCLTWKASKHYVPIFTHSIRHTKCGLQDSLMNVEILLCLISICSPKLWVHNTQGYHYVMCWESLMKLINKASK
jgi:hypothetical protein